MPHPDFLFAVLTERQKREIEWYAGIEPIGWDVSVSRPPETEEKARAAPDVEDKLNAILGQFER